MSILAVIIVACLAFLFLGLVSITIQKNISGVASFSQNLAFTDVEGVQANPTVIAAQPGVLTTRSGNTTGTLTMTNSLHGITTGQRVDLYWTGGQCYGAVVGTVSGTSVPIASVSGGSNLPSATTAITVGIATSTAFPVTGNNITALALNSTVSGYWVFNNGSADVYAVYLTGGRVYDWDDGSPLSNPLSGATPTVVYRSHTNTAASDSTSKCIAVTH